MKRFWSKINRVLDLAAERIGERLMGIPPKKKD